MVHELRHRGTRVSVRVGIALAAALALLGQIAPTPARAEDGNVGIELQKTVDPAQTTVNPALGLTLGVDKASAIPGDTLTYTAVLTNAYSTFGVGGTFRAEARGNTPAVVAYYWDELQYCSHGCGEGIHNKHWIPFAGFVAGLAGYVPVHTPTVATGLTLTAAGVPANGVTYPSSGDPILGTSISPESTATWTYHASFIATPSQIAFLADSEKVEDIRNVVHFEITPRQGEEDAQTPFATEELRNPFQTEEVDDHGLPKAKAGTVTNITVTFTFPDGTKATVNSSQVAGLALLAPGGSIAVTTTFKVPVPAARAPGETDAAYMARLVALEGSALTTTANASGTGFSGTVTATSNPVTTAEHLPIVTIVKSGPTELVAGNAEVNPLALQNVGGSSASGIAVTDSLPGGATGTVTGVPTSLGVAQAGSAQATFTVPASQTPGNLTDTAAVTWKDGNGNSYGPLTSSFTTLVKSSLANAKLTLAPTSAGPNPPGTSQTLTATLVDSTGVPIPNKAVTFNITGANPGTGTAATDANGNAVFTYVGANAGNDVAQATVTAPGVTLNSNTANISWGKLLQPIVTGPAQGNFYPNPNGSCTFDIGPASTPAFGQNFPDILFNAPASAVPHDISTVTTTTRPFTDLTVDVNGNYNGTIVAQGNGLQAGVGSLSNFYGVFNGNFIVTQAGDLTLTILHDDGYILGVGNGATRVSGDLIGTLPATTPFNAYGVIAGWNQVAGSTPGAATIHFPAAGTYPYELDYTECGGGGPLYLALLTAQFIAQTDPLSIYVGYADGLRAGSVFPFPWQGSPGVTFVGGCTPDAGAIRFDNSGNTDITLDKVTVDIGGVHLDIWPASMVVPAHAILILTQTGCYNFDTSDFSSAGCGGNNNVLPLVNVTRGGVTTAITDTNQVLNTHGFDTACQGNESISWQRIAGQANAINVPLPPAVSLNLTPFNVPGIAVGQAQLLTVSAMDGAGNPVPSLPVTLHVIGPNAQILNGTTLANGLALFSYVGLSPGTDSIQALAFISGLSQISNVGTVVWTSSGGGSAFPPPTITAPSPSDGSVVSKPTPITAGITPPSGQTITSWTVTYQAVNGQPIQLASGTGTPPSPLAIFDPTLLTNGSYAITITANASGGGVQISQSSIVVLGGLKIGRYTTTFQDMAVPVTGIPMEVRRSYDSIDTATSGDFGFGWRVSISNFRVATNRTLGAGGWTQYNQSCVLGLCFTAFKNPSARFVTVVFPDGHTEVFDLVPTGGTNIFFGCTPVFTARASLGTTSTLIALDDTACSYTADGNLYGANGFYNPQRFQLTTRDGRVIVLDHTLGLISITDRNGNKLTVDATGVHASNGQGILFTRDGSGRITQVTGPGGQTVTYTYSSAGDLASSTDPLGNVNTYTYDSAHHLLKFSGAQGTLSTQTYDSSGRLTAVTDATGHKSQIQNNVGAQSMAFTDPIGATTTVMTMDDVGDVVREDVVSGGQTLTTLFAYDSVGHTTQRTDPLGHVVHAAYNAQGDLTGYTDALGNVTQFTYDSSGLITSVIAPDGGVMSSATYDANGNTTTVLTPGGAVSHFTYDSAGRPLTRIDAAGNTINYAYDSTGRVSGLTNPSGKTTTFQYDAANQLTVVTDPLGSTIHFTYDAAGNTIGITDQRGISETFTYNSFGNVTSATDPLGATATVNYDAAGHVTAVKDRAGNQINYTHDADGRLTRIDYPGGEFIAFTFDGFGRPTTVANSGSSINDSYDATGQIVTTTTNAPALGSISLTYTYDAAGNRLTATGPDGTASYAYDSRGRLTKVTDSRGGVFGLQYDSASKLTSLTRPNGISDSYSYDANGRLVGIASTLGATTIQNLSQTLDVNGQVASRTDSSGTTTYTHDANGRLVAVSGSGSQTYTYDAAGNRTAGPLSTTSTYNAADELTSDTNFTYTYDAEGQRTSKVDRVTGAITRYTYNGAKQLTAIQNPDGTTTTFKYDPLGRRLAVSAGASTTAYVYDGTDARLEYASGALVASYVGAGSVDRPLEMTRGGNSYYYLQNFQGSVTGLTDSSGSVAASYSYDAFGVPTSTPPAVTNPFTYTGREYDAKSGLYYNRARYYEPTTGSFISQDPVRTGQPYAYAGGDPVDFTDPSGAAIIDFGAIWTFVTTKLLPGIKTAVCGLAAAGAAIEIGLNLATNVAPTVESVGAILVGVTAACIFGSFKLAAASIWSWLLFPIIAAVVAVIADFAFQLECSARTGNAVSPRHAVFVGAAALLIGIGVALLGIPIPEGGGAAAFAAAASAAVLGSSLSGFADVINTGGAC
jgi:RHS repeat-associated protein